MSQQGVGTSTSVWWKPYEPQSWYDVEAMWRATRDAALRRYETTGEVKDRYLAAEADKRAKAAHLRALGEKL